MMRGQCQKENSKSRNRVLFLLAIFLSVVQQQVAHPHVEEGKLTGRRSAGPESYRRRFPEEECGTEVPTDEQLVAEYEDSQRRSRQNSGTIQSGFPFPLLERFFCFLIPNRYPCSFPDITIPVFMHVISPGETNESDDLPDANVTAMIDLANHQFRETGFSFALEEVNRINSSEWYSAAAESREEFDMMHGLKVGGPETLNVYIKNAMAPDGRPVCGYARMPRQFAGILDSVVMNDLCLGPGDGFRNGDTFAHECGHWLNLVSSSTMLPVE